MVRILRAIDKGLFLPPIKTSSFDLVSCFVLILESGLERKMLFGTSHFYDGGRIERKLAETLMMPSAASLKQLKWPLPLVDWPSEDTLEKSDNMER